MNGPDHRQTKARDGATLSDAFALQGRSAVSVDLSKYLVYLDDTDLSAAQKHDVLEALWSVMVAFVDLGFGVHPVQQACGQLSESHAQAAQAPGDRVKSSRQSQKKQFEKAARRRDPKAAERKSR